MLPPSFFFGPYLQHMSAHHNNWNTEVSPLLQHMVFDCFYLNCIYLCCELSVMKRYMMSWENEATYKCIQYTTVINVFSWCHTHHTYWMTLVLMDMTCIQACSVLICGKSPSCLVVHSFIITKKQGRYQRWHC